jgi:hypothetical protein
MHSVHRFRLVIPIIILILMAMACNFPQEGSPTPSGPDLLKTYAAQTIQVQLTLVATGLQPTITPGQPGALPPRLKAFVIRQPLKRMLITLTIQSSSQARNSPRPGD